MDQKKWVESKTLWTNALAMAGFIIQGTTGRQVLDAGAQGVILGLVNLVLRFATKSEVVW